MIVLPRVTFIESEFKEIVLDPIIDKGSSTFSSGSVSLELTNETMTV